MTLEQQPMKSEKKHNALVIEDDMTAKDVLMRYLKNLGIDSYEVSTVPGALSLLLKDPLPDIIFLDLTLYDNDGTSILKIRGQDDRLKTVPVVVTTGTITEEEIINILKLGADGYLYKPIHPVLLKHELVKLGFPEGLKALKRDSGL